MPIKKVFVLAVILVLIMLSLGVYIYYITYPHLKIVPHTEIDLSCKRCDPGYAIQIVSISQPLCISELSYKLEYEENGVSKVAHNGEVSSIYQQDFNFLLENNLPANNISFVDIDLGGRVTTGDYFLIRTGLGKPGFTFKLSSCRGILDCATVVLTTDAQMISQNVTISAPNNRFTMMDFGDNLNVTISEDEPAFSAYPCLEDELVLIGVTIKNNNTTLQHVLVEFYENESYIGYVGRPTINASCNERFTIERVFDKEGEHNIVVKVFVWEWSIPIIANATTTSMLKLPVPC